jgi:hypothetical protein
MILAKPTRWMGLALLALALVPPPAAAQETLEQELALPALEELAKWCQKRSLYGLRSETYEAILHFDAVHSRARRGLKHTKKRGVWVPPAKPYQPKNKDADALAAFPTRRIELLEPYCRAVVAGLEERGLRVADADAQQMLTRALIASPDDPDLRRLLGDVKVAGTWMMEESARASLHRVRLDGMCADALERAAAGLDPIEGDDPIDELGISWGAAAIAGNARVLGTTTSDEVRRVAQLQCAADDFLTSAFRMRARSAAPAAVYLMQAGEQHVALAGVSGLSRSQREFFASLSGVELPGEFRVLQWGRDEAHRVDAVTRHRVDHVLREEFGVGNEDGWVFEGLGGYLNWRLTGTRLTWRVAGSAARADSATLSWSELFATAPERWLLLAHKHLGREGALDLDATTSRHLDDLTALDVLTAHALAAFLVEGRTELAEVLRGLAAGQTGPGALTTALGMDLQHLEWRLARWLSENVLPNEVQAVDLEGPALSLLAKPDDPLLPPFLLRAETDGR